MAVIFCVWLAAGSVGATRPKELSIFPHSGIKPVSSPAEAEHFISKQGLEGNGLIRVVIDIPGLDDDTLQALVDGAHRYGKLVIAHAPQVNSYRRALSVGCEIITLVPIDGQLNSGITNELREKGIAIVLSLSLIRCVTAHEKYPSIAYDNAVANVRALSSAGVSICAGTSATDIKGLSISFADGIYEELVLLVQAGFSNIEALRAATSIPAQAFRLFDRGALEVGKRSDLALLRGDPLIDLSAIHHVERVWIKGIEFNRHVQGAKGVWTAQQCGRT